jgi:5-methylcytosine-specific restriction endonuclease McrA
MKYLILILFLPPVLSLSRQTRNNVLLRQNNKCGLCKSNFTRMVPHEIHHLNHIPKDNNSSNLIALCANCHSAHHRFNVPVFPVLIQDE